MTFVAYQASLRTRWRRIGRTRLERAARFAGL